VTIVSAVEATNLGLVELPVFLAVVVAALPVSTATSMADGL
jgi:hypothetical protein